MAGLELMLAPHSNSFGGEGAAMRYRSWMLRQTTRAVSLVRLLRSPSGEIAAERVYEIKSPARLGYGSAPEDDASPVSRLLH